MTISLRSKIGTLLFDQPRFAWVLGFPRLARWLGRSWVDFHNRGEQILHSRELPGVVCQWAWSSDLTVGRLLPGVSRRLLGAALDQWPIRLTDRLAPQPAGGPLVSFIIGHRGLERLPHLLATLRSILGQHDVRVECIVVEQASEAILPSRLPAGIRHVHARPPWPDMPYSRSWAFNVGARAAAGDILVFHDNDLLVPENYGREIVATLARGYQAARLHRLVFYLSQADTEGFFGDGRIRSSWVPELCRQNCQGGTLACERQAYFDIGGHDEAFVGWGSEDNELFDRLRTIRLCESAYLPLVHLWHGPQPGKVTANANTPYFEARMRVPPKQRIAELRQRDFGALVGPNAVVESPSAANLRPCAQRAEEG